MAAMGAFLVLHAVPVRPPVKPWLVAKVGAKGFTVLYSVVSVLALAWLIGAAGRAPYVGLWAPAPWQSWVPIVVMLPVILLVALAIGRPNPYSFGGGASAFDPTRPGTVRLTRHPLLLALGLWAGVHMVPNGDLAHVLLFGTFAGFAVLGMRMIDRRKQREIGVEWRMGLDQVSEQSWLAIVQPIDKTAVRALLAFVAYVGLLHLHPLLFGVSPVP